MCASHLVPVVKIIKNWKHRLLCNQFDEKDNQAIAKTLSEVETIGYEI